MKQLTHHRVKIDEQTKLLINGSEVLTHKGIKGNIHSVGVGFGTGRHTSGRRLDLLKEVPVAKPKPEPDSLVIKPEPQRMTSLEPQPPMADSPIISPKARSPLHRHVVRADAMT